MRCAITSIPGPESQQESERSVLGALFFASLRILSPAERAKTWTINLPPKEREDEIERLLAEIKQRKSLSA